MEKPFAVVSGVEGGSLQAGREDGKVGLGWGELERTGDQEAGVPGPQTLTCHVSLGFSLSSQGLGDGGCADSATCGA